MQALAEALVAELVRVAPPKIEGGSPARQQWIADVLAVQIAFYNADATDVFRAAWGDTQLKEYMSW